MHATLHLIKGNPKGKQVEVPEGTLTVGRAEDRDLIIASTRVSRQHCDMVNDQNRLVIRDNNSGNGTLVNGNRVSEQQLEPGDQVTIGPLTFLVEIDGVKEKAAPAAPSAAPPAATPAPQAQPKPKKASTPAKPHKPITEDDILSSLENMAGSKPETSSEKPSSSDDEDDLRISDDDLLDT